MHSMFGGNAYEVAMMQHFSLTFIPFFDFATQLFSTPLRHQTFATKLRYLRSSAFYRQPLFWSL